MAGANSGKAAGEKSATFAIKGMHCASCAIVIGDALRELNGVKEADVDFAAGKASLRYEPSKISEREIEAAVVKAGYTAIKR